MLDGLDWLLVDPGSTIHICRDRNKLTNLTHRRTQVSGIISGSISIATEMGDWKLALRNQHGKFKSFQLKNVIVVPNATKDILACKGLPKGWWPHIEKKHLYNRSQDNIFPYLETSKGLGMIPSLRPAGKKGKYSVTKDMSSDLERAFGKQGAFEEKCMAIADGLKYSLWFGGSGAVAHASQDRNCVTFFDKNSESRSNFSRRCPDTYVKASFEEALTDVEFIKKTATVDYIHVTPPNKSFRKYGSEAGIDVEGGKHIVKIFDMLKKMPEVPMVGIEMTPNFWTFEKERTALINRARKQGFEIKRKNLAPSNYGSCQGGEVLFILLVKSKYESKRARWQFPTKQTAKARSSVREIMTADKESVRKLKIRDSVILKKPKYSPGFKGPKINGLLESSPRKNMTQHSENDGFKIFDPDYLGEPVRNRNQSGLGEQGCLYTDPRHKHLVRKLSVKETWELCGKPFPIDKSEQNRSSTLHTLANSDGYMTRAWMKQIERYAGGTNSKNKYYADDKLPWTSEQTHVRCMHMSGWCAEMLGLPKLKNPCKECSLAGIKKKAKSSNRPEDPPARNYRWGCDIVGKFRPKEKSRCDQYALIVVDYHTSYCWVRIMKSKTETLAKFKEIMHEAKAELMPEEVVYGKFTEGDYSMSKDLVEYLKTKKIEIKDISRFPKKLRTDSDSIFKGQAFEKFLQSNDTGIEFSSPGDQYFNGRVEHLIGVLKVKMHALLKSSNLGIEYWPEAVNTCVYTYNRLPTKSNRDGYSPYFMYKGVPPTLSYLRGFGCDCTFWKDGDKSTGSGQRGIFLGYTARSPRGTYHIEVKDKRKGTRIDSRHVIFDEYQVTPKFEDKTRNSNKESSADTLISTDHKTEKISTKASTKIKKNLKDLSITNDIKIHVQDLVSEKRVLVPGPKFHSADGNRVKYIRDRLQMLIGLTPFETKDLMFQDRKGEQRLYQLKDCKYDIEKKRLKLVDRETEYGKAAINMAKKLTPKMGSLTQAVSEKIYAIDATILRDIDGGITCKDPIELSKRNDQHRKAAQPLLRNQDSVLTRDEKGYIVKADHLGCVTGVDITLEHEGTEVTFSIVEDEMSQIVQNQKSGLCECVNLVNPDEDVPQTISKVLKHPERRKWLDSILKEYLNLASKGTWRIALLPKGRKLLGTRLVLRRKVDKDGNISSHKARCVIQGHLQEEGIDYNRLFQPVAALNTLRNQCCFALHRSQDLRSWDFEQAFVQAEMDTDVYIRWPPAIKPMIDKATGRQTCLEVRKAQYGARQSPRCWGLKLHSFLVNEGFERSDTDSCLYLLTTKRKQMLARNNEEVRKLKEASPNSNLNIAADDFDAVYTQIALVVYVDDLTVRVDLKCAETKAIYDKFVKSMTSEFVVEDRGICDCMLGYKIDYDKVMGILKLTQKSCLLGLLSRTGIDECKPTYTPSKPGIKPHISWCPDQDTAEGKKEIAWLQERDYANRVGACLWLARGSKPEISWTVGMLSRFLTKQSRKHFEMSTHLIRYLSTTRDRGIVYRRETGNLNLTAYVDGDWLTDYGNDSDNRKCTTGYILKMCGAAVAWRSFKQQRVSGSSTESEYYSLWACIREVMHTRRQMKECGFEQFEPTQIMEDNQAVKRLSEDVVESTRTRHWDKEWHQIREEFDRGTMKTVYVDTALNHSDVLTKSLNIKLHNFHTDNICGKDWNADEDMNYQMRLPVDRRSEFAKTTEQELEEPNSRKEEILDQVNLIGEKVIARNRNRVKFSNVTRIKKFTKWINRSADYTEEQLIIEELKKKKEKRKFKDKVAEQEPKNLLTKTEHDLRNSLLDLISICATIKQYRGEKGEKQLQIYCLQKQSCIEQIRKETADMTPQKLNIVCELIELKLRH